MKKVLLVTIALLCIYTFVLADNALYFNGTDQYVDCLSDASISSFPNGITLEAWIYPTTFGANFWEDTILSKEGAGTHGYCLRSGGNGIIDFAASPGAWDSSKHVASSDNALSLNTWQHVAGTYDGTIMVLYVNGVNAGSLVTNHELADTDGNLWLGASMSWGRYFNGAIDEVRIWDYARSQVNIQNAMNSSLTGNESGLKAYYKMSDGTGIILSDSQTDGLNDGTLNGMDNSNWVSGFVPETLPVTLSSFTAVAASSNLVSLSWTTQSESNLAGYHIYRNTTTDLENAEKLTFNIIQAQNLSNSYTYSYSDNTSEANTDYNYWLYAQEFDGSHTYYGPVHVKTGDNTPSTPGVELVTKLDSTYPNPFNPSTTVSFTLNQDEKVNVTVYNLKGQKIRCLTNQFYSKGNYKLVWNGTNDNSQACGSGIYYFKMEAGNYSKLTKAALIK